MVEAKLVVCFQFKKRNEHFLDLTTSDVTLWCDDASCEQWLPCGSYMGSQTEIKMHQIEFLSQPLKEQAIDVIDT